MALIEDVEVVVPGSGVAPSVAAPSYSLPVEAFVSFSSRKDLPVYADSGMEPRFQEFLYLVSASGLVDLAVRLTKFIVLIPPVEDVCEIYGRSDPDHISVFAKESKKGALVPCILHELGHKLENAIACFAGDGMKLFHRYVALTQTEETADSIYADAWKELEGIQSFGYVHESFADDFRLYWLCPENLSVGKIAIFDELHDWFFAGLDRENLRVQIRSFLGDYYGMSVTDILRDINSYKDLPEKLKRRREQLMAQTVRNPS